LATKVNNLEEFPINQYTGADARGLPPGEIFLYVFEGTNIGPEGRRVPLKEIYERPIGFQN